MSARHKTIPPSPPVESIPPVGGVVESALSLNHQLGMEMLLIGRIVLLVESASGYIVWYAYKTELFVYYQYTQIA
jgi:hypothetical protein